MQAKRPPPLPPIIPADDAVHNGQRDSDDFVAAHFAALRADEGVSWDKQARSVLIDSAMSLVVYAISAVAVVGNFILFLGFFFGAKRKRKESQPDHRTTTFCTSLVRSVSSLHY